MATDKLETNFEAYKVTNLLSGKAYFGITTVGIEARWMQHSEASRLGRKNALHRAMAKYGVANFRIEPAGSADSWPALCALETKLIAEGRTLAPNGYNMTSGGEGMFAPCDQVRAVMSAKALARNASAEAKATFGARSAALWAEPGAREARGAAYKAAKARPEVRAAQSKRMLAQWSASPEAKAALVARNVARMATPEAREAYGARMRAHFAANPELGAAQSKRMRDRLSTPEARAAGSARATQQFSCPIARALKGAQLRAGAERARAARLAKENGPPLL